MVVVARGGIEPLTPAFSEILGRFRLQRLAIVPTAKWQYRFFVKLRAVGAPKTVYPTENKRTPRRTRRLLTEGL
jgi:hypothetical protein